MFLRNSYYYVKKTRALKKAKLSGSSLASSISDLSKSTDESLKWKKNSQQKQIVEVNNERYTKIYLFSREIKIISKEKL